MARCIEDPRAPDQIRHQVAEMIRFRTLAIAAGYPHANDCDVLRKDAVFKMVVGRLPETEADLYSQPTMTRPENPPGPVALKRMTAAMVELFCDSLKEVPRLVLDIDDTEDRAYALPAISRRMSRITRPSRDAQKLQGAPSAVELVRVDLAARP